MVISRPLSRIAKILLKDFNGHVDVYIHPPHLNDHKLYIVVVGWAREDGEYVKASGNASSEVEAFIKAIVELGEILIVRHEKMIDRNGLAGGIFKKTIIDRAKSELLERDAFLYHYRNKVPFISMKVVNTNRHGVDVIVFKMASSDKNYSCYLASDKKCAEGNHSCLLIGLGAHRNEKIAIEKAIGEYFIMHRDHEMRPGWCEKIEKNREQVSRIADFHHSYSRDERNIAIFKNICTISEGKDEFQRENNFDQNKWMIKKMLSSIWSISYYLVDHPELVQLRSGNPESGYDSDNPLYHPIW